MMVNQWKKAGFRSGSPTSNPAMVAVSAAVPDLKEGMATNLWVAARESGHWDNPLTPIH